MKNKNPKLLFFLIIIISFFLILIFYFSNNSSDAIETKTSNNNTDLKQTTTPPKASDLTYVGNIFYVLKEESGTKIMSKKFNEDPVLIFTDTDENQKIKFAQSMSQNLKILAYMQAPDQLFGGSLYLIYGDGSGQKEEIINDFVTNQSPAVSPDESLIAYVLFSNAEFNYGFSLYTMTINGQNKSKLDNDSTSISNLSFNQDSNKIAYLKNKTICYYDTENNKVSELKSLSDKQNLLGLSWNANNLLATIKNNDESVEIIDFNANSPESFINLNGNIQNNTFWADINMDKIFFVKDDKIYITDSSSNQSEITNATYIIQWLK